MYKLQQKEGVFVPVLVEELTLPTSTTELDQACKTIDALFVFKVVLFYLCV